MKFEKLTPTDEVDLGIYEEAMDFVFSDDEIQNIAISGSYSAGKSSLLASYKKKIDKKFIHISLSHFEQAGDDEEKSHAKLEGKILNQLLHQIEADKIPMTNFRVKNTVDEDEIAKRTIAIVAFILITCYFMFFEQWKSFVYALRSISFKFTLTPEFKLFVGVTGILIITSFIRYVVRRQKNKNIFKKFSFQGNEIELFEEEDASYFDKYLNEVLYLFENADVDAIVFEDMDRFNNVRIFERLREINGLINKKRMNSDVDDKPLRFFYLLRDDIFTTKDRTKFFDYIIPVVPVIDGSNSYNIFSKILEENGEVEHLDSKFLQGISLFIDDMRLLKNICNEFLIYYHRLNVTELDSNKMLAMITYKNIFPKDFSDLQLNKGYIYTLFAKKADFIADYIDKIDRKIADIDSDLEKIETEYIHSRAEIGSAFAHRYYSGYGWDSYSDIVGWIESRGNDDVINKLHERLRIIELKNGGKKDELIKQKRKLQTEKQEAWEKRLSQLITKDTEEKIFAITDKNAIGHESLFNDVKGNDYYPLLKYLIWNGYIDETYADYMTYFYEGGMKKEDKMYLRSVAEHHAKDRGYPLRNVARVVESLRIVDFEQDESLNYDLFEYLLKEEKYIEPRRRIIKQIQTKKYYDFLIEFLDRKPTSLSKAAINICDFWPENYEELCNAAGMSSDFVTQWGVALLCYVPEESLIQVDKNGKLSWFISNTRRQLVVKDELVDTFIKNALAIGIKLEDLKVYHIEDNLFQPIVDNDLYKISMENINHILTEMYGETSEVEMKNKNYTVVRRHSNSALYQYLKANMEIYVDCFMKMTEEIDDDYDTIVAVFAEDSISDNQKQAYAKKLTTTIVLIRDIAYIKVWNHIIRKGLLAFSEDNILHYFIEEGLTIELIEYINKGKKEINFASISEEDEAKESFFEAIVTEDKIENEKYRQIVSTLGYKYTRFNIEDISDQKIEILIQYEIIPMEDSSLKFMRVNYPEKMGIYMASNFKKYLKISENENMPEQDILLVLGMVLNNNISENDAIKLLDNVSGKIHLNQKVYPDKIMISLIENHLYSEDVSFLFENYELFSVNVQKSIIKVGEQYIYELVNEELYASIKLIIDFLKQKDIDKSDKLSLLIFVIKCYDEQDIRYCLELTGKEEFGKLFEPRLRPRFEANNENRQLLQAFLEKGYIQDFSLDENQKYFHYKRRIQKKNEVPTKLL